MVLVSQDTWNGSDGQGSVSQGIGEDWEWTGVTTFYKKVPFLAEPDRWEETPATWKRIHLIPRLHSFHPCGDGEGPLVGDLTGDRVTELKFLNGSNLVVKDKCHQGDERVKMPGLWIGTTTFLKRIPAAGKAVGVRPTERLQPGTKSRAIKRCPGHPHRWDSCVP
jgi:hypothetical protein